MKSKNYKEWCLFGLVAIAWLLATNIYYLRGYNLSTPENRFIGNNFFAAADKLVYYSMIEQGREGKIMMLNLHTAEPQRGLFFSPHWWLIGQTAKMFQLANDQAYHIYRLLLGVLLAGLIYYLCRQLFHRTRDRLQAAALVLFAGGFGWLFSLFQPELLTVQLNPLVSKPVDLYVTELAPFTTAGQSPLFILSQSLLLVILYCLIRWRHSWSWPREIILAGLAFLLIAIHPYDFWLIASLTGVWGLWRWWRSGDNLIIKKLTILMLGCLLGVAYVYLGLYFDPAISGWSKQNLVYSPPIKNYLIGFGFLLPLWLIGSWQILKKQSQHAWWLMVLIWSWAGWLLVYLPLDYNRRLASAWQIPIALVAYVGLLWLIKQIPWGYVKIYASIIAIFLLTFSNVYSVYLQVRNLPKRLSDDRFFLSQEVDQGLTTIKKISTETDVILGSDEYIALLVPAYSGRRLYVGHQHQTVNYFVKQSQADEFWSGRTQMDRLQWLRQNHITVLAVHLTPEYSTQYYDWLNQAPDLRQIYSSARLLVYRVE